MSITKIDSEPPVIPREGSPSSLNASIYTPKRLQNTNNERVRIRNRSSRTSSSTGEFTLPPPIEQPLLSSQGLSEGNLNSDEGWEGRVALYDLPPCAPVHIPVLGSGGDLARISYHGLGTHTPTNNLIGGVVQAGKAWDRINKANEIGNTAGVIEAGVDLGASAVQVAFGADYSLVRPLQMASAWTHGSTVTSMAATASLIGDILFVPLFAGFAIWGGFQACRAYHFYRKYKKSENPFQFLVQFIYVSEKTIETWLTSREEQMKLWKEGAAAVANEDQFEKDIPCLDELQRFYLPRLKKIPDNHNIRIGLLLRLKKMQKTNEATVAHAFGSTHLETIKKLAARGLAERVVAETEVEGQKAVSDKALSERTHLLSDLVSDLEVSYTANQRIRKLLFYLGCAGVAIGVAAFFATGIGAAILVGLTLLMAAGWLVYDAYTLKPDSKDVPGRYDLTFIKFSAAVLMIGITAAIVFFMIMGGSQVMLLVLLGMGLFYLASYAYSYDKLKQKQKNFRKENPQIGDFLKKLNTALTHNSTAANTAVNKELSDTFKKLHKSTRVQIKKAMQEKTHFTDQQYADLNEDQGFGSNFFSRYFAKSNLLLPGGDQFRKKAGEHLRRAVKKTAKHYWTNWWYSNRDDNFKKKAMLCEQLLASLSDSTSLDEAERTYKLISKEMSLMDKLHENLAKVIKFNESTQDLHTVVQAFYNQTHEQ